MAKKQEQKRERSVKRTREQKAVPGVTLFPDESVVMTATPGRISTFPKYISTLGLYELWRRRNTAVVTDQRILFGSGIFQRIERSIPLKNVMDVGFTRRGFNSYAEVVVNERGRSSVKRVGPMSGSAARHFVSEILRRT